MGKEKEDTHPLKEALDNIKAQETPETPKEAASKRPTVAGVDAKVKALLASVDQIQIDINRGNEMVKALIMYFADKEIPDEPSDKREGVMYG